MKYTCCHCKTEHDSYNGTKPKYCSSTCKGSAMTIVRKETLLELLRQGVTQSQISRDLSVDRSTISRAIKRYGIVVEALGGDFA